MAHNLHHEAILAGMSPRIAARYLAYVDLKRRRREEPISVHEAVQQCIEARGNAA